jgi:hypothetical protein
MPLRCGSFLDYRLSGAATNAAQSANDRKSKEGPNCQGRAMSLLTPKRDNMAGFRQDILVHADEVIE